MAKETLPSLREDLDIFLGPTDSDGSPTYTIYDPIRDQYFKVNWQEGLILRYLKKGMTLLELASLLKKKTTIAITLEELQAFFLDVDRKGLLSTPTSFLILNQNEPLSAKGLFSKIFYWRLPLFDPDAFLEATLPWASLFVSTPFIFLYVVAATLGGAILVVKLDAFLATFNYFYNPQGLLAYAAAIISVKAIHELSHAYTAKKHGIEVSQMGIAFIVLWPVLYTDVTHGWAIHDRKQRLLITVSGVISELVIAGLATLLWSLTPPGILQSTFFVLASVTWITSLAVNLNPCMRFDGYYALSDLVGVDNLQPRAFALAHYMVRTQLFGAVLPHPEPYWNKKKVRWVVGYAFLTFIYRFFIYMGIGLFFYHVFTKTLGLLICAITLFQFFAQPLIQEGIWIMKNHEVLKKNIRFKLAKALGILALFAFILPLPYHDSFAFVTTPGALHLLTASSPGKITQVYKKEGEFVKKGEQIFDLDLFEASEGAKQRKKEVHILKSKIQVLEAKAEEEKEAAPRIPEMMAELAKKEAELASLEQLMERSQIKADISGTLYRLGEWVQEGVYVKEGEPLGGIADFETLFAMGYVPEKEIDAMYPGKEVYLMFYNRQGWYRGVVKKVRPLRSKGLRFAQLGSDKGGDLPVLLGKDNKPLLAESFYEVEIDLAEPGALLGQTGQAQAFLGYRSRLMEVVRYLITLFWKESAV